MDSRKITLAIFLFMTCEYIITGGQSTRNKLRNIPDKKRLCALQTTMEDDFVKIKEQLARITEIVVDQLPLDCSMAKANGNWNNVIQIKPPGHHHPRKVRCDQYSYGGGWTVVLRRDANYIFGDSYKKQGFRKRNTDETAPVNFNRTWNEYKEGFGDPELEYWIGNEVLHSFTKNRDWEAAVVVEPWNGTEEKAIWRNFRVLSENENFRLFISGYDKELSDLRDELDYYNGTSFSTWDEDNADQDDHCAKKYGGGWWFNNCHISHLTGVHLKPGSKGYHSVHWRSWSSGRNKAILLRAAKFMIRPSRPLGN